MDSGHLEPWPTSEEEETSLTDYMALNLYQELEPPPTLPEEPPIILPEEPPIIYDSIHTPIYNTSQGGPIYPLTYDIHNNLTVNISLYISNN
tara:strand:- start:178 stop:453 length:276 start_codon:yes stop_codon:yes gene_type:complete